MFTDTNTNTNTKSSGPASFRISRVRRNRFITAAMLTAGALALTACGDDADDADAGDAADDQIVDGVLSVELSDFSFGDLPDEVPAGTRLAIDNVSDAELHELVAIRLPDDETRPADEIVAGDLGPLLASGPPHTVLLAAPDGGEQINAVGDGTLHEPGRYLILCAIPTGVDPAVYLAAAAESAGAPPQVEGGAPHLAHGMWAELDVTAD
jgi:hypothetical protein